MRNFIYNVKVESKTLLENTDEELLLKFEKIKKRSKIEGIDSILANWFAMVQEISFRKIGLRHFETQLIAGLLLHQGKIVEMKTGEGKTLASTLPVALNALTKKRSSCCYGK